MAYAIMRCAKLKSMGSVASSLKHCFRERETPNADAQKTPDNEHGEAARTSEAMGKLREMLPEKRRKDAVLMVEYLMTASPEWWKTASADQQAEFFRESRAWLDAKFGAQNVVVATVHRDETSPHLSAFVVPLTRDGRLSAREFIGNKAQMSLDQTTYAQRVQHLGLERGLERSKARHTPIREFYGRVALPMQKSPGIDVPDASMGDRLNPRAYGERVAKSVLDQLEPTWKVLRAKAQAAELAQKQAKEARAAVEDQDKRLKPLVEALRPLNQADRAKLVDVATAVSHKIVQTRQDELREKVRQQQADREARRGQDKGISR
jgi:hypothetical protein